MSEQATKPSPLKPWYRQFWPWFIIALPASAVIAGLFTLSLALRYQDAVVVDDYYKEGLGINQQMDKLQQAAALDLQILARYTARNGQLQLQPMTGPAPDELLLTLTHPTLAAFDLQRKLPREADGSYRIELQNTGSGRWHIILEPNNGEWRLSDRITLSQDTQVLLGADR